MHLVLFSLSCSLYNHLGLSVSDVKLCHDPSRIQTLLELFDAHTPWCYHQGVCAHACVRVCVSMFQMLVTVYVMAYAVFTRVRVKFTWACSSNSIGRALSRDWAGNCQSDLATSVPMTLDHKHEVGVSVHLVCSTVTLLRDPGFLSCPAVWQVFLY